jgi:hypothetical protein
MYGAAKTGVTAKRRARRTVTALIDAIELVVRCVLRGSEQDCGKIERSGEGELL